MRRNYYNSIAAAWHIPRRLVSIALESVLSDDGQRTNCFNLHVKTRDTSLVIRRFMDRLAEIRYEFYIEGKHWEYIDKIGNTWVEKSESKPNLDTEIGLDKIPDMHQ